MHFPQRDVDYGRWSLYVQSRESQGGNSVYQQAELYTPSSRKGYRKGHHEAYVFGPILRE